MNIVLNKKIYPSGWVNFFFTLLEGGDIWLEASLQLGGSGGATFPSHNLLSQSSNAVLVLYIPCISLTILLRATHYIFEGG